MTLEDLIPLALSLGLFLAVQLVAYGQLRAKVQANCEAVKKMNDRLQASDGENALVTVGRCESRRDGCREKMDFRHQSLDRQVGVLHEVIKENEKDRNDEIRRLHEKLDIISKAVTEVATQLKERNRQQGGR